MKKTFLLILFALCGTLSVAAKQSEEQLARTADSLHKLIFSIDTHNDTAICTNHPDKSYGVVKGQVTFPLMKEGGLDASLFAIYLDQGPRDDASLKKATEYARQEITLFKEHIERHRDEAAQAWCADDFLPLKAQGKSIVMFAIENGYALGKELENVKEFYDMGVRAITLSHNYNNDICDASRDTVAEWGGLSPFGYKVVEKMNELGIMVDVSHVASSTLQDVLECSKAPIIATHSGVWAIKNHPRNLKDEEIMAIAEKGGLIQVATGRFFLSHLPKAQVNVATLVDHIDYVKNLVGIEHVGIGTDFDGGGGVVGLEHAGKMKNVTIEMLRRGYTCDEIALFWGGNFLRFLKVVEKTAKNIRENKM